MMMFRLFSFLLLFGVSSTDALMGPVCVGRGWALAKHATTRHPWHNLMFSAKPDVSSSDPGSKPDELELTSAAEGNDLDESKPVSKREMLSFALPALGIYLSNPLLSNIDNSFVGRTVGTQGLAALSPATICTDQMLYLFSFLGRATTGIVSRVHQQGDTKAAREAAAAPLSVSLVCGVSLTLFYVFCTPALLGALNVNPSLRPAAASYIYWRGSIAWAALAQSVCLSTMMATRDAITPLKIVGLSALVNIAGDFLLCSWPLRWGCSGAAAATAFSTVFSSGFMMRALFVKGLLPKIKVPSKKEIRSLMEFTGPLLAITIARLSGFVAMQKTAMKLGVESLAGYQLGINLLMFFLLFGEPLSQVSQTQLPQLLDHEKAHEVRASIKAAWTLAAFAAVGIGSLAFAAAFFGSGFFTTDLGVQTIAKTTSPALFVAVATAIFTVAVDGAMLASRDFGFMLVFGVGTLVVQLGLLPYCHSVSDIFGTFTFRLGSYAIAAMARIAMGSGVIGKVLRPRRGAKADTS